MHLRKSSLDFPWWSSGTEPSCNAGDMCLRSLVQEDPMCFGGTKPCITTAEPLEPKNCNYCAYVPELLKPECLKTCALQREATARRSPCTATREKPAHSNKDLVQPKNKSEKKKKEFIKPNPSSFMFFLLCVQYTPMTKKKQCFRSLL